MPSNKILEQKKQIVADLAEAIKNSPAGVLVNYQGITVENDTKMRKELREAGIKHEPKKEFVPNPMRPYRMVPTDRLIARIDLTKYDVDAPWTEESVVDPKVVGINLKDHVGAPAVSLVQAGDHVEAGQKIADIVNSMTEVIMQIMMMIIKITPIGVFCLMTNVVAVNGPKIVGTLALVIAVAYIGYMIHVCVVYGSSIKFLSGMSPVTFFKGMAPAMITAFTTTSSNATLPVNIECCNKLGAEPEISSFVLPLGATINMDGTAIYQAVATVFIASCYGVDLTLSQMGMVVLTATLASVGTAGVSGAGMIMLAMVLESIGLPVEGIAIIAGVDKIFDMGRTTLNITGDATCAVWVSKLDQKKKGIKAA